jgi:hypothetical protein
MATIESLRRRSRYIGVRGLSTVDSSFNVVWNEDEESLESTGGRAWSEPSVRTSGRARMELLARKPANASWTAVDSSDTILA